MTTYAISMPVSGLIYKEIEASSEREAIELFYNLDLTTNDIYDWETNEHIVTGNVFHGIINDMDIEEV